MSLTRGITEYTTTDGLPVMVLHYSADPAKDRATAAGALWASEEVKGYPGGFDGPRWLQEMEGRYDIRDTARVWPNFDDMRPWITCPDIDIRQHENWPIYRAYDYGTTEPTVILSVAWADTDEVYLFDEIYQKSMSLAEQAEAMRRQPWNERVRDIYGDPSIWAKTQQTNVGLSSIGRIFETEYDISIRKGQNFPGSDAALIHLLNSVLWVKDKVQFKITESCKHTLKELRTLAWAEGKTKTRSGQLVEAVQTRNVHAFQALKYLFLDMWQGTSPGALGPAAGSIDWEIDRMVEMRDTFRYVLNR